MTSTDQTESRGTPTSELSRPRARAGLIGPGGIGRIHAQALAAIGVEIAAVAASSPASADRHARALNTASAQSAEALIARADVDVVHICTPNSTHFQFADAALTAGKHVVCEKPLATTLKDARALSQRAHERGLVNAVCYFLRAVPQLGELRRIVQAGELGEVRLVYGSYLLDEFLALRDSGHWMLDPAQMGSALTLADIGVHWWDALEHVTGRQITAVSATTTSTVAPPGEDTAVISFELDGNAVANAVLSQAVAGTSCDLTFAVCGMKADARWELRRAHELTIRRREATDQQPSGTEAPAGDTTATATLDAFTKLMGEIYTDIAKPPQDRTSSGYPTFTDGVRGLEILSGALESASTGKRVTVAARSDL